METNLAGKCDPLTWTVFENSGNTPVGIVALLAIAHNHGRAEIGHVWFTPAVHKSKVNTESQFLLLQHLFDRHSYRRVEWKCDSLNHASRTTAARMGFIYEGRFRQHMFVRGKNRDTDWFAMTDKEWPRCKNNFEKWLYSNEKISLMELNNS
ncbi:MAG: GNAT family protein [Nostoc sp. DcaGUA01]|nr:GNAT family protein [Nostoc sp. DcaGUA01]